MKVKVIVETLTVKSINKTLKKNEIAILPDKSAEQAIKLGYAEKVEEVEIKREVKETAEDKVEFAVKEEKTKKAVKKTSKNKK